jgi:hypothetical protein
MPEIDLSYCLVCAAVCEYETETMTAILKQILWVRNRNTTAANQTFPRMGSLQT